VRKIVAGAPVTDLLVATGETFLTDLGPKMVSGFNGPTTSGVPRNQSRAVSSDGKLALRVSFQGSTSQIIKFIP